MANRVAEAATEIHDAMVAVADQQRAVSERAYLKDSYSVHLGVSVGATRRIVKDWRQATRPTPDVSLAVARELWDAGVFDDRRAATELWVAEAGQLPPEHLDEVAAMVRDARTWALVDPLAHAAAGTILTRHPDAVAVTDAWEGDASFWVRRLSVLCLSRPVRAGALPFTVFASRADRLLDEREFFVRKAIGWVLREIGRGHADDVEGFCRPRIARMSGVTWREARKPLAPEVVVELDALR